MGKAWDITTPEGIIFSECYRVLKPGGYILVMASPRNDDLVSIALREAGFVKHNSIAWIYGMGFPKGTDVSKAIDARAVREWLDAHDHGLTASQVRKVISAAVNGEYPKSKHSNRREKYGNYDNSPKTAGVALIADLEVRFGEMPKRVKVGEKKLNPRDKKIYKPNKYDGIHGTSTFETNEGMFNITAPATPEAAEWEGVKYGQQALKPAFETVLVFQKPFDGRPLDSMLKWGVGGVNVDAGRVRIADKGGWRPNCYGKDYDYKNEGFLGDIQDTIGQQHPSGRYPANLLLGHSEGCRRVGVRRVKCSELLPHHGGEGTSNIGTFEIRDRRGEVRPNYADPDGLETVDDWECAEGCPVKVLGEQSGERPSGGGRKGEAGKRTYRSTVKGESGDWGMATNAPEFDPERNDSFYFGAAYSDSGTAARFFKQVEWTEPDYVPFFYTAKASSAERNAGCSGLPDKIRHRTRPDKNELTGLNKEPRWAPIQVKNDHPTCKPVELMRYLIRLFEGHNDQPVILDPFAGSGTTGVAAILEGCRSVLIEKEAEYIPIIKARDEFWQDAAPVYLAEERIPSDREVEARRNQEGLF